MHDIGIKVGDTIRTQSVLSGQGKYLKLKKPEALKVVKMKASKGASFSPSSARPDMNRVMDAVAAEIQQLEEAPDEATVISQTLKTIPMGKLREIKSIMSARNVDTQRKVEKLTPQFSESYRQLLEIEALVKNAKGRMEELTFSRFVDEYHVYNEERGEVTVKPEFFNKAVETALIKQEGRLEGQASAEQEAADSRAGCIVS